MKLTKRGRPVSVRRCPAMAATAQEIPGSGLDHTPNRVVRSGKFSVGGRPSAFCLSHCLHKIHHGVVVRPFLKSWVLSSRPFDRPSRVGTKVRAGGIVPN